MAVFTATEIDGLKTLVFLEDNYFFNNSKIVL
jgi:hypothetical protein